MIYVSHLSLIFCLVCSLHSVGKRLTSWLSLVWCFVWFLSLSNMVSEVRRGTWLYWLLVFAFFLSFFTFYFYESHIRYSTKIPQKMNYRHLSYKICPISIFLPVCYPELPKVRKRAKIRNRYNQAPHLTQDTDGKVTTSQWDITNESEEVSPFSADDHKASINRCARKYNKSKAEIIQMVHKRGTAKPFYLNWNQVLISYFSYSLFLSKR